MYQAKQVNDSKGQILIDVEGKKESWRSYCEHMNVENERVEITVQQRRDTYVKQW